jgi:hypothetical protein
VHDELRAVVDEFESARRRLHTLRDRIPAERWSRRPGEGQWSAGECVAHLNLTSAAFVPLLRTAIDEARRSGRPAPARYRRDLLGWLLWKGAGPPARLKVKTTAPFVPRADRPLAELIEQFESLQADQIALAREGDGLPIDRVTIASPFNTRLRYSVYSALTILPRHQHRHLWQAERVLK